MSVRTGLPSFGRSTCSQYGIRRTSAPRVSTTKPVPSPSAAARGMLAVLSPAFVRRLDAASRASEQIERGREQIGQLQQRSGEVV